MSNSPNYSNKMPKAIGRLSLLVFALFSSLFLFVDLANAATQWVNNPASCNISDPTNFPGQNCSPNRICGDSGGIAQCYNTASLLPPAVSATSNTLYSASYPNGGYIVNCYVAADAAAPFCDNSGAYWCNRSNTCYTTQLRDTTCTANTWSTATCGACRTGYADCNGDLGVCEVQYNVTDYPVGTNNHYGASCLLGDVRCDSGYYDCDASGVAVGNGCEAVRTGACTTGGGLTGTWSCSVDVGGSCTDGASNYTCVCVPPKQYFETGTKAQYLTSEPLLWGVQFGTGPLITFGNSSDEELFIVNNDGSVELGQISAPATTTNKLYNIAGSLYWNGVMIGAGGGGGDNIYTTDGSLVDTRLVTITDGVQLRFVDEWNTNNYLYFQTDYSSSGGLVMGGHNNSEGDRDHYIEFKDNLNLVSEGGIEINAASNQIDMYAANGLLQIGGANSFTDLRAAGSRQGLVYADNYSADFTDRSLVDKAYVDSLMVSGNNIYTADGTLTGDRTVTSNGNLLTFTGTAGNQLSFEANDAPNSSFVHVNPDEMELYATNGTGTADMVFNGSGVSLTHSDGVDSNSLFITSNIEISDAINSRGAIYSGDYEANFLPRSLVTKQYVDSVAAGFITDLNVTVATSSGSFSSGGFVGYEAAKDMCDAEYPGSHFCRTNEVIEYIDRYGSAGFTGATAWIAEGPPGYTSNSNDCNGWTSSDSLKLGAFWHFVNPGGGMGWLTNCAVTKPVACCE